MQERTATREPETFGASCRHAKRRVEQLTSSLPIILEKRERDLGSVPNGVVFCGIRQRLKSTVNIKKHKKNTFCAVHLLHYCGLGKKTVLMKEIFSEKRIVSLRV
ncbi:hypothetical protein NPIL_5541 [Nephila pilipes]|uniref:Uncharacterized protein n=1 Tax=Nephila pilipes TaxID=299642 RepID=A0A8X6UQZ5_NEPPI|nr:hypothetical protein NPIL_5541 [Nephila pilipes]